MTAAETHTFSTILVRSHTASHGVWHFIDVPPAVAELLDTTALLHRLETGRRSGFGAVKLTMRIGTSEWLTSAFPIRETGWSIPVSAKVRKAQALVAGERVDVTLTL